MTSRAPDPVVLAALVGGPGVDGPRRGASPGTTSWQQAEQIGLVESAARGLDLFGSPDPLAAVASRLGLDEVLVRLEWSRLEPSEGVYDDAALERYSRVLDAFSHAGLEVSVVLGDGVLPAWLGVEGWLLPATPERFGRLAAHVVRALGGRLRRVITLEAPGELALAGWVLGAAPPFRTAALRDALAGLDSMLSAHLLASSAIEGEVAGLECSRLPSGGLLGDLEVALIGGPVSGLPAELARWVVERSPGRAGSLSETHTSSASWVVVGRAPGLAEGARGALFGLGLGPEHVDADVLAGELEQVARETSGGPIHLVYRSIAAEIDASGRRTVRRGPSRRTDLDELGAAVRRSRAAGVDVGLVVLGELTDRWRLGSTTAREGLVGVDRLRGDSGPRLLTTDAADLDLVPVLGALRAEVTTL